MVMTLEQHLRKDGTDDAEADSDADDDVRKLMLDVMVVTMLAMVAVMQTRRDDEDACDGHGGDGWCWR